MSYEALFWGILPAALGVAAVIISLVITCKTRRVIYRALQFVASLFVLLAVAWSLWFLYRMFAGKEWPFYLPHLVIGVAVVIVLAQVFLFRSQRHDIA